MTTVLATAAIYLVGGGLVRDFAFAMLFGVIFGTYSSIFIASPVVLWWVQKRHVDLRQDVLDAAAARALAQEGLEREVAPRKL